MEYDAHIAAVERELAAMADAVAAGPLDAPVPTCPDFDVEALAAHVGGLLGFWIHLFDEAAGRPKTPILEVPDHGDRAGWLRALGADFVAELRATDPGTEVWTWFDGDHSARFWARRAANELAIHRVDAQVARGTAEPVDAALALDGIDEVFLLIESGGADGSLSGEAGSGQTIHLHGTDREDAEWLVTLDPGGARVERVHAKGDLALRGAVSDLEMLLYQRPTVGEVERFGDETALDAFHALFTFG